MRRLRILFVLLAVALVAPTALLARRALQSVELERRARHESVAERLFDEMERALSGFLASEEDRPFGQYAHDYTPPGEPPSALVRSPLAEPPALPFVIGYFQADPDGNLRFPVEPQGKEDAPALSPQASAAVGEIERAVGSYWRAGASGGKLAAAANAQAPGSTLALDADANAPAPQQAMRDERKSAGRVSAYDALRSLNKGIEQRADRQTKISREYASEPGEEGAAASAEKSELARPRTGRLESSRDMGRRRQRANEADRFELTPMVGRMIAGHRLVLYRTVVHDGQGYRQGLLLDVDALGAWLEKQSLGASELAGYAKVSFSPDPSAAAPDPAWRVYQHRFAEPFEELSGRLELASLPGLGDQGYVYALAVLSIVVAVLGLGALYRMVTVVVRYAEQRSNFVAAVTHELKTPLTAIRMYGEMLRDGMVASEKKRDEYHRHITGESERLTRLVDNVLELSRLEKGARRVRLEPADLGAVVREVAVLTRPHVESAGFAIRCEVEEGLPPVAFERDGVKQMLFNLVDNAVKYANGTGPKTIDLVCGRSAAGITLAVRDRGPGVGVRHLRRIFEPFYRGETELTRRTKGTGIGLALVRGLAEEMRARASGRNRPDGGFEVEIVFPPATG